jgi:hypothetical protein
VDGVLVPSLPLAPEHLDHLQRLTTLDDFERFEPWSLLKPFLHGAKHGEGEGAEWGRQTLRLGIRSAGHAIEIEPAMTPLGEYI